VGRRTLTCNDPEGRPRCVYAGAVASPAHDVALFLLLLIVAVALGVIGALGRDTLYLLIIGVMVLIADLVFLRTRMGRSHRSRVR